MAGKVFVRWFRMDGSTRVTVDASYVPTGDMTILAEMADAPQQEDALRALLRQELETAFARLCTDAGAAGADPFRFSFWAQNLLGPDAAPLPAVLQVIFA